MMIPLTHPPSPPGCTPKKWHDTNAMHGLGCGDKIFQGLKSAAQKLLGKPRNEDFFGWSWLVQRVHIFIPCTLI